MILHPDETRRFYRLYVPLLSYANKQHNIIPDTAIPEAWDESEALDIEEACLIRNVLWENDEILTRFVEENPANFSSADLDLVSSWHRRVFGNFYIFRCLKKHAIFLNMYDRSRAYGVVGLFDAFEDMPWIQELPVPVKTVLLPFGDRIIYDGILQSFPVLFGRGVRKDLNHLYREIQECGGVYTSLLPQSHDEMVERLRAGNKKVLNAFQKYLVASMSKKKAQQHLATVNAFAEELLQQDPPAPLLDMEIQELREFLHKTDTPDSVISFKHFRQFLFKTTRTDWETLDAMRDFLQEWQKRSRA